MNTAFESFQQGARDVTRELGDPTLGVYCNPDVSEEYLDTQEYMRGQICAILTHLKGRIESF